MIPLEEMPEYRKDLSKFKVEFPELDSEQTARHPEFVDEVIDYLVCEGEDIFPEDLTFLRSAQVGEDRFWIWEFFDDANDRCYVTVAESGRSHCVGYDSADGLTPEQAMLADHHVCY